MKEPDMMQEHFTEILKCCGFDLTDENFKDTPSRMTRMFFELLHGHTKLAEREIHDLLRKTFPSECDEMILVRNISSTGLCPHHLLPVRYTTNVAYISNGSVIGLSKIPRLVDLLCRRAVMQESLTYDIAHTLMQSALNPLGVAVHITGIHSCATLRGIKANGSDMVTTCLLGCLKNTESKTEFLQMIE